MKPGEELLALVGTRWQGEAELWLDPLGNTAEQSACTLSVESDAVRYSWSHQGKSHQGVLAWTDAGAVFTDSFHYPGKMDCLDVPDSWALLDVCGNYAAGEGPEWGWRLTLSSREPTGELVLQMTNVCPWGEHGRAMRMACRRS